MQKMFSSNIEKNEFFLELVFRFYATTDFLTNLYSQHLAILPSSIFCTQQVISMDELETQLESLLFQKTADKKDVYGMHRLWLNLHKVAQTANLDMYQIKNNKGICNLYMLKGKPIGMLYYSKLESLNK